MPRIRARIATAALSLTLIGSALAAGPAQAAIPYTVYSANWVGGSLTPINAATNLAGSPIVTNDPDAIAITPDGGTAYAINYSEKTVTPITLATGTAGTPISVGLNPYEIAITPDGTKAYVTNHGDNTVTPINLANQTAGTPIAVGANPYAVAVSPDGTKVYVTNNGAGTVTPIDVATNTPGTPITVGSHPQAVAFTPDGTTAYIGNYLSNTVTPITVATDTAGSNIAVNDPDAIAITPDGAKAYVANYAEGTVTPITLATSTPGTPITGAGTQPYAIAITPDGASAYVADDTTPGAVTPIDLASGTAGTPVVVGARTEGLAIPPDQAPVASFTVTPASAGSPSSFDASASTVAYGTITSYDWDFGDGNTATTSTPTTTHTYAQPGNYTAQVTETDSAGTSMTQVFTGQTMSRNGGSSARTTRPVSVGNGNGGGGGNNGGGNSGGGSSAGSHDPSGTPSGSQGAATPPGQATIKTGDVRVGNDGVAAFTIACGSTADCSGSVSIELATASRKASLARRSRPLVLGRAKFTVKRGKQKTVKVQLSKTARRMLRDQGSLSATLKVTTVSGGKQLTSSKRIKIVAKAARRSRPRRVNRRR